MITVEQYRRTCADALDASARAAELAQLAKDSSDENLRQRAYQAWRQAQNLERDVRTAPLDVIAEAIAKPLEEAPKATAPHNLPPLTVRHGCHITTEEMCTIVQYIDAGYTIAQICEVTGRAPHSTQKALAGWRAGTSRCARRAQLRGMWPSGRVS